MNSLGGRIKSIRSKLNLNQEEFAKKLKLKNKQSISFYEVNKTYPSVDTLIEIAKLGEVTLDWLLLGDRTINISQKKISGSIAGVINGDANVNNNAEEKIAYLEKQNKFLEEVIEQKNSLIRQYEKFYADKASK
ncbi:MAG: helix-turn-helix domain-containing protein [Ignavibacteriaceae bacterium]